MRERFQNVAVRWSETWKASHTMWSSESCYRFSHIPLSMKAIREFMSWVIQHLLTYPYSRISTLDFTERNRSLHISKLVSVIELPEISYPRTQVPKHCNHITLNATGLAYRSYQKLKLCIICLPIIHLSTYLLSETRYPYVNFWCIEAVPCFQTLKPSDIVPYES